MLAADTRKTVYEDLGCSELVAKVIVAAAVAWETAFSLEIWAIFKVVDNTLYAR